MTRPERRDVAGRLLAGRVLAPGEASGPALVLAEPLSLWGGSDPRTGLIVDRRHPQHGTPIAGRVLVMAAGRGSSSSSSILAEAARVGTAPAAILLAEADLILAVGAVVAAELYDVRIPVIQLTASDLAGITDGMNVRVTSDGVVETRPAEERRHPGA